MSLRASLLSACLLLAACGGGLPESPDAEESQELAALPVTSTWGMNTNVDNSPRTASYIEKSLEMTRTDLRGSYIREGVGWVGGTSEGQPFKFGGYVEDVEVAAKAKGLKVAWNLKLDGMPDNPDGFGPRWERNVRYFVRGFAQHYGPNSAFFVAINEPDGAGLSVALTLRINRIAYEALKSVSPNYQLACGTSKSGAAGDAYTRQLLMAGITRFCDLMDQHKYGPDVRDAEDPTSVAHLWQSMRDARAQQGHPMRPVITSENGLWIGGIHTTDVRLGKAHWEMLRLVQLKRFGLSSAVLYSLAYSLADNGSFNYCSDSLVPRGVDYQRLKLYHPSHWLLANGINGGFETPQPDKDIGWLVYFNPQRAVGNSHPEWERARFVQNATAAARTGDGYLQMLPGGKNVARRLVEGLVPGRTYKLSAFAKLSANGGEAALAAYGFDKLDGLAERVARTRATGSYVPLTTSFTAVHPWAVLSLEHNGTGQASWDDVTLVAQ